MGFIKIRTLLTIIMMCGTWLCQAQHSAKGLEKLLGQLNKASDGQEKASLLYKTGLWYERDKGYEKEIQYLEQAYRLEKKLDNQSGQINNLEHLVYAYKQVGLYPDAIAHSKDLLKIFRKKNDQVAEINTIQNISQFYKLNNDYKRAISYDKDLVKIYKKNNRQNDLVKTYADLGFLYLETNKAQSSLAYYEKALQLNQNIAGQSSRQGDLLINMGFIYGRELNNQAKAKEYYLKALAFKQQTKDIASLATLHNEIGQIDYKNGNKTLAQGHAQKAINLAQTTPNEQKYNTLANSYQLLADLHANDNNHKTSAQYYAQYLSVKNVLDSLAEIRSRKHQEKLREVQVAHAKARSRLFAKERRRSRLQDLLLKQENEIKELKLKEKEADLLKKREQLQEEKIKNAELERNKVVQLLALAKQKRQTDQQRALAEKQRILTEKQKLENEKKQKELEAAEKEKELQKHKLDASKKAHALQKQELKHIKERNQLRDYLFVLFAAIVVLVVIGLISTVRSRKKLQVKNTLLNDANDEIKEQKEEIMVQNEELHNRNEEIEAQRDAIELEKDKSDQLLLNILPYETAQELKNRGAATPQHYTQVSVLFTDFKGFTKLAEKLTPKEVITELNHCFTAFDDICKKHNIEKIKTIGDAYMAAGGIPVANDTNPVDAVNAGLEMQAFMAQWKREKESQGLPVWELRLGVHTGEIVAGVVGKNKFAYDIWGDTVNLASRMESSGEAGMVNISGDTYELVKNHFQTEYRGKIKAKNKGEVDMYFVKSSHSNA